MTNNTVYRDMTKFWGKLFGINFALGVTTGLTMEFQFGTNWAYLLPLCRRHLRGPAGHRRLDGLLPGVHLRRYVLLRLGSSQQAPAPGGYLADGARDQPSALWILVANGWMQNPVGAEFNFESMRMEMVSFADLVFNPVAQVSSSTPWRQAIPRAPCSCSGSPPITC